MWKPLIGEMAMLEEAEIRLGDVLRPDGGEKNNRDKTWRKGRGLEETRFKLRRLPRAKSSLRSI